MEEPHRGKYGSRPRQARYRSTILKTFHDPLYGNVANQLNHRSACCHTARIEKTESKPRLLASKSDALKGEEVKAMG